MPSACRRAPPYRITFSKPWPDCFGKPMRKADCSPCATPPCSCTETKGTSHASANAMKPNTIASCLIPAACRTSDPPSPTRPKPCAKSSSDRNRDQGYISRFRQRYEPKHDCILPHPGSLQDVGSTLSHKTQAVRKVIFERKDPAAVAREINHTQS